MVHESPSQQNLSRVLLFENRSHKGKPSYLFSRSDPPVCTCDQPQCCKSWNAPGTAVPTTPNLSDNLEGAESLFETWGRSTWLTSYKKKSLREQPGLPVLKRSKKIKVKVLVIGFIPNLLAQQDMYKFSKESVDNFL